MISPFFRARPHLKAQPEIFLLCVVAALFGIAALESGKRMRLINHLRDWFPIGLTLAAFREMELFLPRHFTHRFESVWISWDRAILNGWRLRSAIESFGTLGGSYFEFCYLLVYGLAAYCVWILYLRSNRASIDGFWIIYLTGTLLAYASFPYFPSEPPRYVFAGSDLPSSTSWFRQINLFILSRATIHVGVFPSAHVSSAFSAAWAMFVLERRRPILGMLFLIYAISVGIATVYGRYHYAADVLAGFALSLVAGAVALSYRSHQNAAGQ